MKNNKILNMLPPYLFAQLDETLEQKLKNGEELLILTKSDPDCPAHPTIVEALREQSVYPENHHYPDFDGLKLFRERVSEWYLHHFQVTLNPDTEILPLQGSKEGLVHFCQAFLEQDDLVLIPDPAFPTYRTGTSLTGAVPYFLPLRPPKFEPDFASIPLDIAKRAKLMFLNYPNNPTGATVTLDFWHRALEFARQSDLLLINDHAYAMTKFNPDAAPSLLTAAHDKKGVLEFFTFSKAFNMAGWRLAVAVGDAEIIRGLKIIETHVNAGVFYPIQYAGAEALHQGMKAKFFSKTNKAYQKRLQELADFFNSHGWDIPVPAATVYLWVPAPQSMDGDSFSRFLLDEGNIAITPGRGFGEEGKEYVRFCVTYPDSTIKEAIKQMEKLFKEFNILPPSPPSYAAR